MSRPAPIDPRDIDRQKSLPAEPPPNSTTQPAPGGSTAWLADWDWDGEYGDAGLNPESEYVLRFGDVKSGELKVKDTIGPHAPTGLDADTANGVDWTFSWNHNQWADNNEYHVASDTTFGSGFKGFVVKVDGDVVADVSDNQNPFNDLAITVPVTDGGQHTWSVEAFDWDGNGSGEVSGSFETFQISSLRWNNSSFGKISSVEAGTPVYPTVYGSALGGSITLEIWEDDGWPQGKENTGKTVTIDLDSGDGTYGFATWLADWDPDDGLTFNNDSEYRLYYPGADVWSDDAMTVVDTVPPDAPTNLDVNGSDGWRVLSWFHDGQDEPNNTLGSGFKQFKVTVDGEGTWTTQGNSLTLNDLDAGTYSWSVEVSDKRGRKQTVAGPVFTITDEPAAFNPRFYDARMVDPVDYNQNGYAQQRTLQVDVDSDEPGDYYLKIFQEGNATPLVETQDYHVDGYAYDWHDVNLAADSFAWSQGTVDLRIEMYDAATDALLGTRDASMDASLNDVKFELSSQDSPFTPYVEAVRITNGIDQDLDGHMHQYDVEFDVTAQVGSGSYYVKVYDWATKAPLGQTAVSTSSVGSTDTVSLTLNVDDGGFRHSTRALKIELYKAGSDHLVATHTSTQFTALAGIDVEPSADDVAEPGETLSTARNLGSINSTDLYSERDEIGNGPFGDKDIDLYRVRVTQEGDLTADVDARSIGLSDLDAYLRILDSAGNQIAYNDDKTTGEKDPLVTAFVQPGTYYVGVSARENRRYDTSTGGTAHATPNNLGEYEVEISLASAQPPVGGEYQINEYITIDGEYELSTSGNAQTASGVVSVNNILTVYGSISFDNDLDVWGNGEVVLENLPVLGDMQLYEGEFEFNASDLITDTLNEYASALEVVGMEVHASSIRLVQDGVEVRGYINLPNVLTPNPDSDPIQLDIDGQQYVRINTDTGDITYDMTLEVPEVKLVAGGLTFEAQDAAINLTNDPLLKATLTGTYMLDIPPYLDDLVVDLSVDQGRYLSFDENFDLEFNGAISADEIQIVQNVVYIEDLLIELDSVEQRYYGAGVIGLPIGDGVEIGAEIEFINGHLNTVGLVGNDLDIPVWGAPPIYLQRAGGSVSGLYTGPLVLSPVLSLSAGPTIKGYSLLRLDGEVDIDLSGRVDGRVAVYVVGDEDNALANGQMRVIWDKSYGVYLSGALNAGFVDGEPTFTVNGQAALDNYGNFQGRLNGTAQIPSTVPVIGSILGGQQVSTTVYTQVYDDSDLDNDYLIGSIMVDLPIIGEIEHAIELNYNTGKIDWNASMDRVKTVTFPGVQDMAPEGMTASTQMIETFEVASDVEWVIFRAGWETGETDLTLVDPLGNTIDPTNVDTYADIEYVKSATEAYYVVASPASGSWVLDVTDEAGIGELTMEHLQHADSGTITMVQPATPQAGSPVLLEWTAEDSDSDAVISLYYDTDQTGADGTLIATGISEDNDPSSWSWDTSDVPAGDYYVYAVIDDAQEGVPGDVEYGHFTPKVSYAPGRITIADPQAPSQVSDVTTHGGTVDTDEGTATAEVVWSAAAGDVDHYVVRYTDTASGEEYTSSRAATDTDITLTGLTLGETYRVEVSAVTVIRNVEGDIESIHTGPASDAIVLVAGNEATVSLGADEWDVFAPADQLYSAKVPGADGATYIPVNVPGGAQVTLAGQFEWYVPASGAEGWHEVLVHVVDPDTGVTTAEQSWLLVDTQAPQWQASAPTAEAVSATSVEITAPVAVDASAGLVYRFERDGQMIGDWQLAPSFTDTALAPNASYEYRVQVRDASTGERVSGWTDPVTATTQAAVASAPQLGEVDVDSIEVLSLAPDANPAGTEYALMNVTTGEYVAVDGSASGTAIWQQAGDWSGVVVSGLQADTTYGLGVIARNADGLASEIGEVAYATTDLENIAPTVASIDVQFSSGNIRIEFTEAVDLDVKDIEITNRVTGEAIDLSLASFIHEQGSNVVEINFNNALANGLYDLRLRGNSVQDLSANLLAGDGSTVGSDYVYQFHRVFCDANGDTRVDISDAMIWLNNYDPLGQNDNSPNIGDWDGDGAVGMGDILVWQRNYDAIGLL